ncbi:MAG: hypothetical protein ACOH5I_17905 [Oligoflexus sp.]
MKDQIAIANDSILNLVRTVIQQIAEQKFKVPEVEVVDGDVEQLKFSEQMALILLNGPKVRMFFKFHFAITEVKALLQDRFPKESFNDMRVKDYMKEFCNLVAGKLKSKLSNANLRMGQSLPISLIGYNEIFFRQESHKYTFAFNVSLNEHRFMCSASLEYTDDDAVQAIVDSDLLAEEDADDVAFL